MEVKKCPRCGKINEGELDFCIYCGTFFDYKEDDDNDNNIFFIKTNKSNGEIGKQEVRLNPMPENLGQKPKHRLAIILGYIFAILGGLIGFVFAIYLITRNDPVARRHGFIQLVILLIEYIIIAILFITGQITLDMIIYPLNSSQLNNMSQMSNMSSLYNTSQINMTGADNFSSLFGF